MQPQTLIITLALLTLASFKTKAQVINPNEDRCYIVYEYDAAGQRIKRYYHCSSGDEQMHPPIGVHLYPNPTAGPTTIFFDDWVSHAHLRITNMQGILIATQEYEQCQQLSYDLTPQPPGTYIFTISLQKEGWEDITESITVVKVDEE